MDIPYIQKLIITKQKYDIFMDIILIKALNIVSNFLKKIYMN